MASLNGNVWYATQRVNTMVYNNRIPGVPIVVQNVATNVGVVVYGTGAGSFYVFSIPNGVYRVVEAYGATGGIPSPISDFTAVATTLPIPTPQDPPLSMVTTPTIANTNQMDSLSPNTFIVDLTSGGAGSANFIDSSIMTVPITLPAGITLGNNMLTLAGNGIWGTLPAATPTDTNPVTYPYANSMSSSLLNYVNDNTLMPPGNTFTMTNINTTLWWFFVSNHTTFDERSSFLIVNGGDPNALLFQETVNVNPNSFYLASAWILGIHGGSLIGFRVLAQDGVTPLFYGEQGSIPNYTWVQLGQIFNTQNNSQITVQVLSMSPNAGGGNDFGVDDVVLKSVDFGTSTNLSKFVDKTVARIGDTLTYTSVLVTNATLANVIFQDTLPTGVNFNTGSVVINGIGYGGYNPGAGFTIPSVAIGTTTITFTVGVVSVPIGGVLDNISNTTYSMAPIPGNTITNTIWSNTVSTSMQYASLTPYKAVNKSYATVGDTLIYTITFANAGNISATNSVFLDTIPQGTTLVAGSVVVNGTSLPGASPDPSLGGVTLGTVAAGALTTITFELLVLTIPSINPIVNTGVMNYSYTPAGFTLINVNTFTNTVSSQINKATLRSAKAVDKQYANLANTLTYNIYLTNYGNVTASQILFIDTLPSGVTLVPNSLIQDGVTISSGLSASGVTLPNSISSGASSTITFQVVVLSLPLPNPIVNWASQTYQYVIDPTTINGRIGSGTDATNTITTQVNHADLGNITKFTDKTYAKCQETITYTLVIPNQGSTTAQNVFFTDSIPSGTLFVPDSLTLNGVTVPGANPSLGITLPDLGAGHITTLTFKVQTQC